ncbi:MAG TPA: hypothetical protein PKI59_02980 [Candidatus Cloacimonadota bacterium]|nr:hypothetical protein [Candidatus Cloacimonadota bacterium]
MPVYPKRLDTSISASTGVSISDTYYTDDDGDTEDAADDVVRSTFVFGGKAAIGVSPRLDVVASVSGTEYSSSSHTDNLTKFEYSRSSHYKIGAKYLLWQEGKRYFSVFPSLYTANGYHSGAKLDNTKFRNDFTAKGLEGQCLYTYKASKHFSATAVARAQYNRITKDIEGTEYGPYSTYNYGIRGNIRLSAGVFHFTPEIGVEFLPIKNGSISKNPVVSVGFGVQL